MKTRSWSSASWSSGSCASPTMPTNCSTDLDKLDGWPEKVRTMQRNWIGRSEGAHGRFQAGRHRGSAGDKISVFTTRIDTIYGATSHAAGARASRSLPILIGNDPGLRAKVEELIDEQTQARKEAGDIGAIEKHGVFTGRFAINPFSERTVPIWVANYILMDYGTGAIMCVPAHDERDFEFAKKYGIRHSRGDLPRRTASCRRGEPRAAASVRREDSLLMNSGEFSGLTCAEARRRWRRSPKEQGFGKATVTYRLKDWGISRQRYWGTPIPMIYCETRRHRAGARRADCRCCLPENVEITLAGRLAAGARAGVRQCDVSEVRRPGAARDRHHGHVRRFVLVLLSLHRCAERHAPFDHAKRRSTGFPSTSTSAAWSTPSCT